MFVETKEAGEVQQAPAKVLKLSEAIRIGAALRPQCVSKFFDDYGGSCALGAAWEGSGRPAHLLYSFGQLFGIFNVPIEAMRDVATRNDFGHSREQIAEWLESRGY